MSEETRSHGPASVVDARMRIDCNIVTIMDGWR